MSALTPLDTLYDVSRGDGLPLPPEIAAVYGRLAFPSHPGRPHVIANFVSTLDGVVALTDPGHGGGGEISGADPHDQMVMGLLRAVADAVIVGAGTVRSVPDDHLWTATDVYPPLADAYAQLRTALGKPPPLMVMVAGRGTVNLDRRAFWSGETPALIVTTERGAEEFRAQGSIPSVQVVAGARTGRIGARAVLEAVGRARPSDLILVEGGPHLLGHFFAEHCLDELFLTLAPQVAGRGEIFPRLGLVEGKTFLPEQPLWGALEGVKRGGSLLLLRYSFPAAW